LEHSIVTLKVQVALFYDTIISLFFFFSESNIKISHMLPNNVQAQIYMRYRGIAT